MEMHRGTNHQRARDERISSRPEEVRCSDRGDRRRTTRSPHALHGVVHGAPGVRPFAAVRDGRAGSRSRHAGKVPQSGAYRSWLASRAPLDLTAPLPPFLAAARKLKRRCRETSRPSGSKVDVAGRPGDHERDRPDTQPTRPRGRLLTPRPVSVHQPAPAPPLWFIGAVWRCLLAPGHTADQTGKRTRLKPSRQVRQSSGEVEQLLPPFSL